MGKVVKGLATLGAILLLGPGGLFTALTGSFLGRIALSVGLSILGSKLFGPKIPNLARGLSGISVTTRSTLEYHKIVYGRAMVSGPICYNNLSGTNDEYLWFVIPLCLGESTAIEEVWFDGDQFLAADIDWSTASSPEGSGTGIVTTSGWSGTDSPQSRAVRLRWALGHPNQQAIGRGQL